MEPQPNPSSTPPPARAVPPPPAGTGAAQIDGVSATAGAPEAAVVCPACGEPRAEGARFCEECGHDYGGAAPAPVAEERSFLSGPVLWVVLVIWVILIIAGLLFLYNALWAI